MCNGVTEKMIRKRDVVMKDLAKVRREQHSAFVLSVA